MITLKDGVGVTATVNDIVSNPKNLTFNELEAANVPNVVDDVDIAIINGNYAIQAGLNPTKDAVILESADEDNPYVNIVACQAGHENDAKIQALITVLQSDDVKNFITETWADGSVIPVE